jgi:hypothetical protein
MTKKENYLRQINVSWKMRLFLLKKLPAAWFMGIGVRHCDHESCTAYLPYGWRSQNPFRSIYFAAQCAAGELSTGLLATASLLDHPPVSMLVTHVEAEFVKKAAQELLFTCPDGEAVAAVIQRAVETQAAQTFQMTSTGRLPDGSVASVVRITWSFKAKSKGGQ